jgi:hypothetical protein
MKGDGRLCIVDIFNSQAGILYDLLFFLNFSVFMIVLDYTNASFKIGQLFGLNIQIRQQGGEHQRVINRIDRGNGERGLDKFQ